MAETIRGTLLEDGIKLTEGDRNKQYGDPLINFGDIAALWTAYLVNKYRGQSLDELNFAITDEDVAHLCVLMKMSRTFQPGYKADTYTDGAVYFAIAGELRVGIEEETFTEETEAEYLERMARFGRNPVGVEDD